MFCNNNCNKRNSRPLLLQFFFCSSSPLPPCKAQDLESTRCRGCSRKAFLSFFLSLPSRVSPSHRPCHFPQAPCKWVTGCTPLPPSCSILPPNPSDFSLPNCLPRVISNAQFLPLPPRPHRTTVLHRCLTLLLLLVGCPRHASKYARSNQSSTAHVPLRFRVPAGVLFESSPRTSYHRSPRLGTPHNRALKSKPNRCLAKNKF